MKKQQSKSSAKHTQKNPRVLSAATVPCTEDVLDKDNQERGGSPERVAQTMNCSKMKEVETMDIGGIIFYLDVEGNVYNTYDVLNKKKNPQIIGKYVRNDVEHVGHVEYF